METSILICTAILIVPNLVGLASSGLTTEEFCLKE